MSYTITIVRGEQPGANGVELDNPNEDSPIYASDLPAATQEWIQEQGEKWQSQYTDAWVMATPAGEDANAVNVLAVHTS